jgi:hypothetical protein
MVGVVARITAARLEVDAGQAREGRCTVWTGMELSSH